MRAYLRTFGCRANQYDTEAVRAMLVAAGAEVVEGAAGADVVVFNSCAVTAEAEADLRQAVRRVAPGAPRVIVMGCAAARDDGTIAALPGVTDVIGGADLAAVAEALDLGPGAADVVTSAQTGARALLRIQDGCDEHCTFCATTLARGASRSRPVEGIVQEATALAAHHPEVVLTGIHIGAYGADTGTSLGALVERLVRDVREVRFRLTSVEATEVDGRLADLLTGDAARVCPHLHAPLQSGSDAVLRRMGRHWYSSATYARAVERLAARAPVFGFGADVVSGFPGETDADHEATVAVVRSLPFTYLHVFPYSPRPGTAALRLGHPPAPQVVRLRTAELRAIGDEKRRAHEASRDGARADVVVVGDGQKRLGLTEDYLSVSIEGHAHPRRTRFAARLRLVNGALTCPPCPPSTSRPTAAR